MPDYLWPWLGDIHLVLSDHWTGLVSTMAAVACGALIGAERQRAQKPAGMRTLILICLGAAIFTQASILIVGPGLIGDRSRIAAQVVSGIGFLGAGAIIRERGLLIGVTTAAGIWATAAVGVVLGSGHVAAGFVFTLLILSTLAAARWFDRVVMGPCRYKQLEILFDAEDGKTRFQIQGILDDHAHDLKVNFKEPDATRQEVTIQFCDAHRDHRTFLRPLMRLSGIVHVSRS